jgi:hypothetical protein
MSVRTLPPKDDPPLVVDPDAVKPLQITLERLEAVARWGFEIGQIRGTIQVVEFLIRSLYHVGWESHLVGEYSSRLSPAV